MSRHADFTLEQRADGPAVVLTGDWTATNIIDGDSRLIRAVRDHPGVLIDLTRIGRCDTAGAWSVIRAAQESTATEPVRGRPRTLRLLELVDHAIKAEPTPPIIHRPYYELMERIGRGVFSLYANLVGTLYFLGGLMVAAGRALLSPARVRWAACINQAEVVGVDAIPIVATTSFFIGAVVGLLGANLLTQFGAQVFAVELIGIAVLREFGILITALLLAGRSASSFAAEIGAMKMRQEIDAMRVLGIDPFDALVLPRFVGLFITIPLLTFVAVVAGLVGGLVVTWSVLGIGPLFYFQRLVDSVGVTHFWVGLSKAPVLAAVIAGIGCRQGMEVGGDVESLGQRVTASVVQAIFATILIDACFALFYMKLDI